MIKTRSKVKIQEPIAVRKSNRNSGNSKMDESPSDSESDYVPSSESETEHEPSSQSKTGKLEKKKFYPSLQKTECVYRSCHQILSSAGNLKRHLILIHGLSSEDIDNRKQKKARTWDSEKACPNCGKKLLNSCSLIRHMKKPCTSETVENKKNNFPCRQKIECCAFYPCDQIFANTSNLRRHLKNQHGMSSEQIEICKKMRTCKSERTCPHCGKKVANSSNLHRHIQRYCPKLIIEKVHKCSVCATGFDFAVDLKHHMILQHTIFWCAYCTKEFTNAENLRLHVRLHIIRKDKEME